MSAAWRERLVLAAILVLSAALRLHDLDRSGYWNDEFASLVASNGQLVWANQPRPGVFPTSRPRPTLVADALPPAQIAHALVADNHPPLYFAALRGWRALFGDDEPATRRFSVLASVLALAVFFAAVRELLGGAAALWAALLLALAVPDVAMARETRSYALLMLLLMLAAAALARLETRGASRGRAVLLGCAACAAMLVHYFAAFALAPLAVHALFRLAGRARRHAFVAFAAAAVLFLAAWGPYVWYSRQVAVSNADWLGAVGDAPASSTLARVASLPARLLVGPIWAQTPGAAWPVLGYAAVALVAWRRPAARLWLVLFAGVVAGVAAVDLWRDTRQLVVIRYVLPALPALCALLASGRGKLGHLVPAVVALALAVQVPSAYPPAETQWRRWVRALDREAAPGEPLVLTFRDRDVPLFYKAANHYGAVPRPLVVLTRQPSALQRARLPQAGSFWLATEADPEALLPGARVLSRLARPAQPPTYRMTFLPGPDSARGR